MWDTYLLLTPNSKQLQCGTKVPQDRKPETSETPGRSVNSDVRPLDIKLDQAQPVSEQCNIACVAPQRVKTRPITCRFDTEHGETCATLWQEELQPWAVRAFGSWVRLSGRRKVRHKHIVDQAQTPMCECRCLDSCFPDHLRTALNSSVHIKRPCCSLSL